MAKDKCSLYDHIILNEGAYFYYRGTLDINKKGIESLFDDVMRDVKGKTLTRIVRREETDDRWNVHTAYCSLLVFKVISTSPCFDFEGENIPKEINEEKLSYLLIVEHSNYVVITKRNIAHLSSFVNKLEAVDSNKICGVLVKAGTAYQLLKLTNMNMNEEAMRNKTYEANHLENSMPMYGASQNIIKSARFSSNGEIYTITVNTSRVGKFGKKKRIHDLLCWIDDIVNKLDDYTQTRNFLSRFSQPVAWNKVCDELEPSSILINVFDIQDYIEKYLDDKCIYRKSVINGEEEYLDETNVYGGLIRKGARCWSLTNKGNGHYVCTEVREAIGLKNTRINYPLK